MEQQGNTQYANDAEQAVLGAMLIDKGAIEGAMTVLEDPNRFYKPSHRNIYSAIVDLFEKGQPADITTVAAELEKTDSLKDCGGRTYLSELASSVATAANIEQYATIVRDKATTRQIRDFAISLAENSNSGDDTLDMIEKAKKGLSDISGKYMANLDVASNMADMADDELTRIISEKSVVPIAGADNLTDILNGGFHNGHTMAISAAAGQGKSDLMLWIMDQVAQEAVEKTGEKPPETLCIYISMEMGRGEHFTRSLSRLGHIDSRYIDAQVWTHDEGEDTMNLSDSERQAILKRLLGEVVQKYKTTIGPAMYILHGDSTWDVNRVKSKVSAIRADYLKRYGLEPRMLICIDPHNELSTGDQYLDRDETRKTGIIASQIKQAARDMDVPIILISDVGKKEAEEADNMTRKASQTDSRSSYQFTHRMNHQFTLKTGGEKLLKDEEREGSLEWVRLGAQEYMRDNNCVYAWLKSTKNRGGINNGIWFIYDKAFHTFHPIIKKQLREIRGNDQ